MVWKPLLPSPNSSNSGQGWWILGEGSQLDVNGSTTTSNSIRAPNVQSHLLKQYLVHFTMVMLSFLSDNVKYRFQSHLL